METISESLLSGELQELYLQNNEWMSQLLFLGDESRFFQKLFVKHRFYIDLKNGSTRVELINESLLSLEKRTVNLKGLITQYQQSLETVFKDPTHFIGIMVIEDHAKITRKMQELLYLNQVLKSELFALVEDAE